APEVVVIDLCGDVQAPAVRPEPEPGGGDVEQELPDARVGHVQLGQRGQVPPRLVAQLAAAVGVEWVPVDEEPVQVGALLPVLEHVVELQEAPAGVVEDAVEDHAHAALVSALEQLAQRAVASQERVDPVVVVSVVAVVRGRLEDRVEVERRDAERPYVVQPLGDAQQVAALVAMHRRRRTPGLEVRGLHPPLRGGEPVREDLIEDRVLDPLRRAARHGLRPRAGAHSGLRSGNSTTSRMLGASANSIASLSMPSPRPPVGGIPYSSATRKSSSRRWASSSPVPLRTSRASNRLGWSRGSLCSPNALPCSMPTATGSNRSTRPGRERCPLASGLITSGWSMTKAGPTMLGST